MINELVSNGETTDWVELANPTDRDVKLAGWTAKDDSKKKGPLTLPDDAVIPAGGYYVFDTDDAFGLGNGDEITIKDADGKIVDYFSYDAHAKTPEGQDTSWGRIPDMNGTFVVTGTKTRGAANQPYEPAPDTTEPANANIKINEVESNGDEKGDWIELFNTGDEAVGVSGWLLLDDNDSHTPVVIPDGTQLAPKSFLRVYTEDPELPAGVNGFGLGSADTARLFTPGGELVDEISWSAHATDTLGRIPDGTGEFVETKATPEAANEVYEAPAPIDAVAWPNDPLEITDIDLGSEFNVEDMSGVDFDSAGRAWIVNNSVGTLWALDFVESNSTYKVAGSWKLRYPDGTGDPDAEGVTIGHDGAIYVATERDNANKKVSRPSILRFDVPAAGSSGELVATDEWKVAKHTGQVSPNGGLEAISYIPSVGKNMYALGVEDTGEVLFVELGDNGDTKLVQRYKSPFAGVMALDYDMKAGELRALCDQVCDGQSILLKFENGSWVPASEVQARPSNMTTNFANEGYATFTKTGACDAGTQRVATRYLWADDDLTNGTALRAAVKTVEEECEVDSIPTTTTTSGTETSAAATSTVTVAATTITTTPVTTVTNPDKTATTEVPTITVTKPGATTTVAPTTTKVDGTVTATETAVATIETKPGATTTVAPTTTKVDGTVTATETAVATTETKPGATTTVAPTTTKVDGTVTATETAVATTETKPGATTTVTPTTTKVDGTVTATETAVATTETKPGATTTETPVTTVTNPQLTVTETAPTSTVLVPGVTATQTPVVTTTDKEMTEHVTAGATTVTSAGSTVTAAATTVTEPGAVTTVTPTQTTANPALTTTKTAGAVIEELPGVTTVITPTSVVRNPDVILTAAPTTIVLPGTTIITTPRVTVSGETTTQTAGAGTGGNTGTGSNGGEASTTRAAGANAQALNARCVSTLTGWGVTAALLIPAALLAQLGIPIVANLIAPVNEVFAQFNAAAQAQLGFFNPALADQAARLGAIAGQVGPLLATMALGITAVATIADSCGNTTQTTVATTERLIGLSSR
ncbi:lamin tail domain-containing protein [Corynebacterium aquatimens]|uniref:lamin tail domain-containing protein n=1 Tax=Corynebacterium aquatimens TaxID=1190508 RepID=UPI00254227F2|nr:lamin tail domain-containing protein [Corynebacterium aquatimens]QYH19597.1 lamin tail domain-containing protein [Corynebacterium aquatimens]